MRISPEYDDAAIVLLGNFNPRIFRPDWFGKHCLIGEAEADAASIEIIHPEICIFKMTTVKSEKALIWIRGK
ncbi:MAG TPA: hypothetical protein ENI71_02630 [Chromatiales bacterium]|nr:hypothetical protein [Chromatiales bacterium]